jgi:hypothetical protein
VFSAGGYRKHHLDNPIFPQTLSRRRTRRAWTLIISPPVGSGQWIVLVLCLVGTVSCGSKSRPERWVIPDNYVGWLRLDYAIDGAAPLPIERGAYLVQMPRSGRLQTSSPYNSSIDRNEFFVATTHGPQKLEFPTATVLQPWRPIQEYSVQDAFGFVNFVSGKVQRRGSALFWGPILSSWTTDDGGTVGPGGPRNPSHQRSTDRYRLTSLPRGPKVRYPDWRTDCNVA